MTYREHPAPAALTPWLDCGWERSGVAGAPVRVLPDGCIDIVWTEGQGVKVVGPNTTAFVVALGDGVRVAGVRMRPGAAAPLLGIDAATLRDGSLPIEQLWGDAGRRLEDDLERDGTDPAARLACALLDQAGRSAAPDPLVRVAVARLYDPRTRIAMLSDELAVSARQLRRRFESAVGYGPKRLARVLRLERALRAARAGEELAQAAATAGYADQAHFAHDCRALAGVSPGALLV